MAMNKNLARLTFLSEGIIRTDNGADKAAAELLALSTSSLAWCDFENAFCASK